jgi:hypothetical protein
MLARSVTLWTAPRGEMMSDRNNETGQFAAAEQQFGQAGVEHDAGFRPMPEPEDRPEPESDIKVEVERLQASRAPADDPVVPIEYQRLDTGEKAPTNETVDLDRVAKDLSTYHGQQADEMRRTDDADIARYVDGMRAEVLEANPDLAKELGLSKEEIAAAKAAKAEEAFEATAQTRPNESVEPTSEPDADDPYSNIEGLEPETREALKKPQVRAFLETNAAETDQAVQSYKTGLQTAHSFAQAAVVTLVPELAQIPPEQWAPIANALKLQGDPRGQQLERLLSNVANVSQHQQVIAHHEQAQRHYQFETLRQEYGKQSEQVLGPMTPAEKYAMAEDLVSYLGEYGLNREQVLQEAKTNLAFSHPAFNALAKDALKWRAQQKAVRAVPVRGNLPPVTRPGTSFHRSSGDNSSQIAALQKQVASLTGDKAARAAAKLQALQRKAG